MSTDISSFGNGTQNVNTDLCNSTNTLLSCVLLCLLLDAFWIMFANICPFYQYSTLHSVNILFCIQVCFSEIFNRFFQWWTQFFCFLKVKIKIPLHCIVVTGSEVHNHQMSLAKDLLHFPNIEKYQECFLIIFICIFLSHLLWNYAGQCFLDNLVDIDNYLDLFFTFLDCHAHWSSCCKIWK